MSRLRQISSLTFKLLDVKLSATPDKQSEYKKIIFYALKDMGGVYIKFLQVLAVTYNFMNGWSGPKESAIFNNVDLEPLNVNDLILDKSAFAYIDESPIGAGSFAQVYQAQLVTGETVAIKALRPSIAKNLESDLYFLTRIANLMKHFLPDTLINYDEAVAEFCKTCLLETDYEREMSNMEYFYDFYQNHPSVIIPKLYKSLSSKNIIVQDFIAGPTYADILALPTDGRKISTKAHALTGSNLWNQLTLAGGEFLRMAITADYVFGDPHPGNIKLLPNDKIAFIDFGIIASKPTSQKAFYNWVLQYNQILHGRKDLNGLLETTLVCYCPDLANAFRTCIFSTNDSTNISALDTIIGAMTSKMDFLKDDEKAQNLFITGHLFQLFSQVLDENNSLGLKLDINNFQLLKACQAYLAMMTSLDHMEGNDKFSLCMQSAMDYALAYADISGVPSDLVTRPRYSLSESYEIVLDTFSSLASRDEFLFNTISSKISL